MTPTAYSAAATQSVYASDMPMRSIAVVMLFALAVACSGDDATEQTSQACKQATECYPSIDSKSLRGERVCLDRVTNGYCTHLCTQDSDCCATPGECKTGHPQVCGPFESTGQNYCFLSCEDELVTASKATDSSAYCATYANAAFGCHSTGGGKENRKVCMP